MAFNSFNPTSNLEIAAKIDGSAGVSLPVRLFCLGDSTEESFDLPTFSVLDLYAASGNIVKSGGGGGRNNLSAL